MEIHTDNSKVIAQLQQQNDELERNFELGWKAGQRAIKRWQAETGKDMEWPDKADLCFWLMNKIESLDQQLKTARREAVEQYLEGQLKSVKLSRSLKNKTPLI